MGIFLTDAQIGAAVVEFKKSVTVERMSEK